MNQSYLSRVQYNKFWSGKSNCPNKNVADLWAEQIIVPAIFYIYDDMIDNIKEFFNKQTWQFWFEWIATAILIIGVYQSSFNIFPSYLWFSFVGNLCWMVLGIVWKKWSLFVVELIIVGIYFVGLVNEYLKDEVEMIVAMIRTVI